MTSGRLDSVLHPLFDLLASHKRDGAELPLKWLFQVWGKGGGQGCRLINDFSCRLKLLAVPRRGRRGG